MQFNATTFLFEIVNFVVLLFVLQRLVFRPLKRSIDARRAEEERRAEETATKLEATRALERELVEERRSLGAVRDKAVREAAEEAAAERARILAQARADAAAERSRTMTLLEAERDAAQAWVREVTVERATAAAGKMLLALAPGAVEDALRTLLLAEVARLGGALAPAGEGEGAVDVELRCAKVPESVIIEAVRSAVAEALGRPARLSVREDEALIAGLVLRVGDRVLDASVAGQLEGLRDQARAILAEGERG